MQEKAVRQKSPVGFHFICEGGVGVSMKMDKGNGEKKEFFQLNRRRFLSLSGISGLALIAGKPDITMAIAEKEGKMTYPAKDYNRLIGMEGFSETLLKNHFTLYQGYVTNTNKLMDGLSQLLREEKTGTPEYAELKRRLGWEFNGMRLHEYYFENLGGKGGIQKGGKLFQKLTESFGSYEAWEKDFKATGSMRGIGWAVLYQDVLNGKFINFWINEHDVGHPAGGMPILIMDVFEHAFMIDYGLKRANYIEAFFKNINWAELEKRLLLHKG
jgi:Fe-Mn family superoxide dismutase